jgi:hypothetical protein
MTVEDILGMAVVYTMFVGAGAGFAVIVYTDEADDYGRWYRAKKRTWEESVRAWQMDPISNEDPGPPPYHPYVIGAAWFLVPWAMPFVLLWRRWREHSWQADTYEEAKRAAFARQAEIEMRRLEQETRERAEHAFLDQLRGGPDGGA